MLKLSSLLPALLSLASAALLIHEAAGCPKEVVKVVKSSDVRTLEQPTCFTLESMRIEVGATGFSYSGLGPSLNLKTCTSYCSQHNAKSAMVSVGMSSCNCNKYFKDDGERPWEKCNIPCPGSPDEMCGGLGYVAAYPTPS